MKKLILLLFIPLVLGFLSSCDDDEDACPDIYQPVCGNDDITYSNNCYALAAGISSWSEGECEN